MVGGTSFTKEAGKSLRILIIEDDRSNAGLIARIAEKLGFIPECAGSLEEAKHAVSASRYDCITLDLGIGKSSGVEIFRHFATHSVRAPIIVVSGADQSIVDLAVAVGNMTELELLEPISKPIELSKLKATLSRVRTEATAKEPDRRKISRSGKLKAATISFDGGDVIRCVIRNLSAGGACLDVASPRGVPDNFDLIIESDHIRHSCRVAWRKEKQMGVAFR
jgi:CheY-like chemotaxis protein